ncbi:hypothetical protein PHYSODRAFT_504450 [Phytophthora sojae]|uniref:EF-hand domain-containing protein n=1 Tax=Phytophthora sojae (strain P6497) TaxID=1094619 RepID=G4ZIQ9_PHYSP|nr:hypothetical protein PHYSODRAFT_504450 [Phytophthora sojae]EGZ17720.1 hypothetical protein PHYSODRAFT_504450 [Phytophthora sojae]|eukprot:XP_009526778.1 hypothetical protein PHYSODRAFT_504450 [Phytophthora sojae]
MLFTRAAEPGSWQQGSSAWSGSDSSSPRRVTFATPSPVVFRSRQPRAEGASPYAADLTQELQRRPRTQQQQQRQTQRNAASALRSPAAARPCPRPRRPGWDADVSHNATLFDASLKKSVLFQPRAGDRRREEGAEKENTPVLPRRQNVATSKRTKPTAARAPVRYRSGPSSVYAQPRQNVTHWPQRRTKDFRLSAPRISKALLRSHVLPPHVESEASPEPVRSPSASSLSPPRPASAASPVLTIDPPAPDQGDSSKSTSPSPGPRKQGLGWSSPYSSPQRSQQSYSSRHSPTPRSSSTNRSSGQGSRTRRYDNYPARVFGVLDRDNEKRIGVSQILQGLRLLGLPATHNQISDYVYLIHEGRHNTIDLEEWEILANVVAEHQPMRDDDPYLEEIQNRIEGIFERAHATATLKWAPELGNNQHESYSRSDRILKRAATVVYSLRASLFPLVHQAEATLREIQQRHGSKLSLFLPPGDMAAIAQNSDMLASAILDDILLDTVQLLNDEDKQQSYRQLEAHHADQLDDILARIQDIERQEDSMIQQGLALSYDIPGTKCDLPTALRHEDASSLIGNPVKTSILEGKRLQSIERRRHKFQHHRRLVESSLAETGMAQFAVIEILEEMLLDDLVEQTAAELSDTVLSMSDTLLINLL